MPLLTVAELRKHLADYPTGDDYDDALARLLEAAELAVTDAAGPVGDVTEYGTGGSGYLILNRTASAITSIIEDFDGSPLTLEEDDYRLSPSGNVLSRLNTGTHSAYRWLGNVQVIYTPVDDTALREVAAVSLVQTFVNLHPGLQAETIGPWSETYMSGADWTAQREAILATLRPSGGMRVI